MALDFEAVASQVFRMLIPPTAFPVLAMLFQVTIGVSLRLAHKRFSLRTKGIWYTLDFSIIYVTFPTLWKLRFSLWAGPGKLIPFGKA